VAGEAGGDCLTPPQQSCAGEGEETCCAGGWHPVAFEGIGPQSRAIAETAHARTGMMRNALVSFGFTVSRLILKIMRVGVKEAL
jgi:hypothetical protein